MWPTSEGRHEGQDDGCRANAEAASLDFELGRGLAKVAHTKKSIIERKKVFMVET